MRIVVAAVGRMKPGPERELAERYRKRAAESGRSAGLQDFDIIEIKESRAGDAQRRMLEESIAIANIIPEKAVTVILDGRGEDMTSASFAGRLQGWRSEDRPTVVFIIGGADGLATSLGRMPIFGSPSGRRPGRTSSCESCCWSSSTGRSRSSSGHPYHRE